MMNSQDLPKLKELFHQLRHGVHIAAEDGEHYRLLCEHQPDYAALLDALGFKLIHHPHQFFYLGGETGEMNSKALRAAVFMMVLIDDLLDQGHDVTTVLFERAFTLERLPHLEQTRYRDRLQQVSVTAVNQLENIAKWMESKGFAHYQAGRLRFRAPAMRFIDLCLQAFAESAPPTLENPS